MDFEIKPLMFEKINDTSYGCTISIAGIVTIFMRVSEYQNLNNKKMWSALINISKGSEVFQVSDEPGISYYTKYEFETAEQAKNFLWSIYKSQMTKLIKSILNDMKYYIKYNKISEEKL